MKTLQIINEASFHSEIIETLIIKYEQIIEHKVDIIKIHCVDDYLKIYLKQKYPKIIFEKSRNADYYIHATFYPKELNKIKNFNKNQHFFISHRVDQKCLEFSNIFYLTPIAPKNYISSDILPFSKYKKMGNIPIYIVQGNLNQNRRNYNLLTRILKQKNDKKFIIKLLGKGYIPEELVSFQDKFIFKNNLNFIEFHKEFIDAYAILPLINKINYPQYYTKQLTSTINYAKAYNLKAIIDKDLQNIYNLENAEIYKDDIMPAFEKSLSEFYLSI
jgi:hypothetical protein